MATANSKTARPPEVSAVARNNSAWAFTIAGWSGFYVMMVELLSSRLIAPFFGNNIYIWGSIIFVFMLGLAIGYLLGGIYSRHNPRVVKLCVILWASAAATLPTVLVGDFFMNWVFDTIVDPRFGSLTACIFLYFVPTVFAGMISPYAIRIIVKNRESSGYDAGYLYFVSTVGSSAGTLLTSFYFVLWFDVNTILLIGMSISLVLGGLGILANRREKMMVRRIFISGLAALAACTAFAAFPVMAQQRTLHEERSLYRNITVVQVGDERCMLFRARRGLGRESCMLVTDPDKLVFDYAPMMLSSLYLNPDPKKILIIGQGGGTLPMALKELVPNAEIDVIEIDAAVDRIARRFFMYEPTPKIRTVIEDGRVYVKRAGRQGLKYDLVMLDAFEADYIPEHMLTKEFLEEVKAIMTPNGVLAANTFSSSALYDHESVTYRAVFGTFFNLKIGNRIIITRLGGINDFAEIRANAARYDAEFRRRGGDPDHLLRLMDTRIDWNTSSRILTDQYSPSNVLNSLPRN